MGVLACVREGCGKPMCDRFNRKFGYLCNECFEDLVAYLNEKKDLSEVTIQLFMDTAKEFQIQSNANYRAVADSLFPLQE